MGRVYASRSIRRRQIAEAALAQLEQGGISGLTIRSIAARIEIADGSIFRHFKTKEEIVLASLDVLEDLLFVELDGYGDFLDKLHAFFHHRAHLLAGRDTFGRFVFSDQLIEIVGEKGRSRFRSWSKRSQEIIAGCLRGLESSGRLKKQVPIDELVAIIQGRLLAFLRERTLANRTIVDLDAKISTAWTALTTLILEPSSTGD